MARWRRLERIGNRLVRCAEVTLSTKGELRSPEQFLARHPYYREVVIPAEPADTGFSIVIPDDGTFLYSPPTPPVEERVITRQMWPETEDWARWIAAGSPDDWNQGKVVATSEVSVLKIGEWHKGLTDVYNSRPKKEDYVSPDSTGDQYNREYAAYESALAKWRMDTWPDTNGTDLNGYGYEVDRHYDGYVTTDESDISAVSKFGEYVPMVVESTGRPMVQGGKQMYMFRSYFTDYIFKCSAQVETNRSVVTEWGDGTTTTENTSRKDIVGVVLTVRVRNGTASMEYIYDGEGWGGGPELSAVQESPKDGDQVTYEAVNDPDFPQGVDYRPGM